MRPWPIASWPFISSALACAGPSQAVKTAEAPAESAPAATIGAAADSGATEASGASEAAATSAAPATQADVSAILQLVVDDPELDKHLHLEQPGRFPLRLAGEALPSDLSLVKATEPVKVVNAPKSKQEAVLVITAIDVQGDKATVRYRFDIEGIRGTVTLARSAHGWELKNSRLVEH